MAVEAAGRRAFWGEDMLRSLRKHLKHLKTPQNSFKNPIKSHRRAALGASISVLKAIDDFESHLGEATEKCERNRGKYERLARMLIDVKAGISHLAELLVAIKLEGEAPVPMEMSDETVEEVLQESEKKISKLLSASKGLHRAPFRAGGSSEV